KGTAGRPGIVFGSSSSIDYQSFQAVCLLLKRISSEKNDEPPSYIGEGGNTHASTTLPDERRVPDVGRAGPPHRLPVHDPEAARTAAAAGQPEGVQPFGRAAGRQGIGTIRRRAGGPMRVPFGKYQDVELNEVPRPYLRWLRRQEWLGAWLS